MHSEGPKEDSQNHQLLPYLEFENMLMITSVLTIKYLDENLLYKTKQALLILWFELDFWRSGHLSGGGGCFPSAILSCDLAPHLTRPR